jgi:hypothetical protein
MKPGDLIIVHDNFSSGEPTQIGVYIGYRVGWGSPMHTVLISSGIVERIESELELLQSCENFRIDRKDYS